MDLTCDNCRGPCTCGRLLRDAKAMSLRLARGGVTPRRPTDGPQIIVPPPSCAPGDKTKH